MVSVLIAALIWLLIFGLVVWIIWWAANRLLPEPMRQVATVVIGVVAFIILLLHFAPLLTTAVHA